VLWIFITRKNPLSSVGLEPATEYPVGSVASTLTTRPPRASFQLPTDGSNPSLDVLFNIHSGAFLYGWGHEFGQEILMDRDIIWVTINYRLGFFGKMYKILHKNI
jgi:hypothetical protein